MKNTSPEDINYLYCTKLNVFSWGDLSTSHTPISPVKHCNFMLCQDFKPTGTSLIYSSASNNGYITSKSEKINSYIRLFWQTSGNPRAAILGLNYDTNNQNIHAYKISPADTRGELSLYTCKEASIYTQTYLSAITIIQDYLHNGIWNTKHHQIISIVQKSAKVALHKRNFHP